MKINSEFIWGIIIGCLLTIFGAFIQSKLYENYDKKKIKNELELTTSKLISTRQFLASNVITASSSTVFEERWEAYISDGLTPWNINRSLMIEFITEFHNKHLDDFKELDKKFYELNKLLIDIRRQQSTITGKSKLNEFEKNASIKLKEIGHIRERIDDTILKLKY